MEINVTNTLDIKTEEQLWRRLRNSQNQDSTWQPTILVMSHREWLIDSADQVIILNQT
ncbi:MAG: hypothetical protein IGS39_01900 [Calothrix sp. C42_A2020_038]|nr:hypothetical protein [Calothrix sp. C42_A2020_038]